VCRSLFSRTNVANPTRMKTGARLTTAKHLPTTSPLRYSTKVTVKGTHSSAGAVAMALNRLAHMKLKLKSSSERAHAGVGEW
jgi:hypothetical protein